MLEQQPKGLNAEELLAILMEQVTIRKNELKMGSDVWSACPYCQEEIRKVGPVNETMMVLYCDCGIPEIRERV